MQSVQSRQVLQSDFFCFRIVPVVIVLSGPAGPDPAAEMPIFGKTFFALALVAAAVHVFRKDLVRVASALRGPAERFAREVADQAKKEASAVAASPPAPAAPPAAPPVAPPAPPAAAATGPPAPPLK